MEKNWNDLSPVEKANLTRQDARSLLAQAQKLDREAAELRIEVKAMISYAEKLKAGEVSDPFYG